MDVDAHAAADFRRELVHARRTGLLWQTANLENQRRFGVIVKHDLRIRRFRVIHVTEPSADAQHARRECGFTREPAGDIHLVNALVAKVAAAVSPEPVPIVMNRAVTRVVAARQIERRRATPKIVINGVGHFLRPLGLADAAARLVTLAPGDENLAEVTGLDPLDHLRNAFATGTTLRSGLAHLVVFARGVDDLPALPDVVRHRLFEIDILARLHGPYRGEGVPVIRRGDGHHVNILVLQQLSDVRVTLDRLAGVGALLRFAVQNGVVHVAQRHEADAGEFAKALDVILAASAKADHGHADIFVGATHAGIDGLRPPECREQAQRSAGQRGGFDEGTTIHVFHNVWGVAAPRAQFIGVLRNRFWTFGWVGAALPKRAFPILGSRRLRWL